METLNENYCSHCGRSVAPLDTPHVDRDCDRCGRKVYLVESGEGGRGIRVEEGDMFTLPPGSISFSLDPREGGRMTKAGLKWFIQKLMTAGRPESAADLEELLAHYEEVGKDCLGESELLSDLELDREEDQEDMWRRLRENQHSQEFWAGVMLACTANIREILDDNDDADIGIKKALWDMYHAVIAHSLFTVKGEHFEEILWQGYSTYRFLTQVEQATVQTSSEARALSQLQELLGDIDEEVVYTWMEDDRPIGPRIGVEGVPEETLRALCRYHLDHLEREREEMRRKEEAERKHRELIAKYISVAIAASPVIGGGVWWLLKLLGWI